MSKWKVTYMANGHLDSQEVEADWCMFGARGIGVQLGDGVPSFTVAGAIGVQAGDPTNSTAIFIEVIKAVRMP
jgi:hypothetical protein